MNDRYLIIDCNFLCHRAFHASKELLFDGKDTRIIYGFLKEVLMFQAQFETEKILFCWDSPTRGIREQIDENYKKERLRNKENLTEDEKRRKRILKRQIRLLKDKILPKLGYRNIYCKDGYEGDDLVASLSQRLSRKHPVVIVSTDNDLYQLINHNTSIYLPNKRKMMTVKTFKEIYGIGPEDWVLVKAIGGCQSDGVKGVPGIGEKTAIKFLDGTLNRNSVKYQLIKKFCWDDKSGHWYWDCGKGKFTGMENIPDYEGREAFLKNLELVCLPLKGCSTHKVQKDKTNLTKWKKICRKYGINSFQMELKYMEKTFWRKHGRKKEKV